MGVVRVTAHLSSPVVLRDDLHIDGLFASAHPMCRERPIDRSSPAAQIVEPPLPIARATYRGHTVFLATVAQFPNEARMGVEHVTKRRDGEDVRQLAKPVHFGLGPGKNQMMQLPIVVAPSVSWLALGERKSMYRLVKRISFLGAWRSAGYGMVREWTLDYMDTSTSAQVLIASGTAQRNLPAAWVDYGAETIGAYRAPYWHPSRQQDRIVRAGERCALPADLLALVASIASEEQTRAHKLRHRQRRIDRALAEGRSNSLTRKRDWITAKTEAARAD